MVKMHKLTKGGQTIYPATIYDAVVNPKTRKSLTTEISDLDVGLTSIKNKTEGIYNTIDQITDKTIAKIVGSDFNETYVTSWGQGGISTTTGAIEEGDKTRIHSDLINTGVDISIESGYRYYIIYYNENGSFAAKDGNWKTDKSTTSTSYKKFRIMVSLIKEATIDIESGKRVTISKLYQNEALCPDIKKFNNTVEQITDETKQIAQSYNDLSNEMERNLTEIKGGNYMEKQDLLCVQGSINSQSGILQPGGTNRVYTKIIDTGTDIIIKPGYRIYVMFYNDPAGESFNSKDGNWNTVYTTIPTKTQYCRLMIAKIDDTDLSPSDASENVLVGDLTSYPSMFMPLMNLSTNPAGSFMAKDDLLTLFFYLRDNQRKKYVTSLSKTYYVSTVNGLDTNDGLSDSTPLKTLNKADELMTDGDTVLIERGSIFNTEVQVLSKEGIRVDCYGDMSKDKPLFLNLQTIPTVSISDISSVNDIESLDKLYKLRGYSNIYVLKHHYGSGSKARFVCQVFLDGKRNGWWLDAQKKSSSDAMDWLENNPGSSYWFSGYDSESWGEGDYYIYLSTTDIAGKIVEITHEVTEIGKKGQKLQITQYASDIRNIVFRGGDSTDGTVIPNGFYEGVESLDFGRHGFLFNRSAAPHTHMMLNCRAVSRSGANGEYYHHMYYNYHYYGELLAFIGCEAIGRHEYLGTAFAGHGTSSVTGMPFDAMYLYDCYCEGVNVVVGANGAQMNYLRNIRVKEVGHICIRTQGLHAVGIFGTLYPPQNNWNEPVFAEPIGYNVLKNIRIRSRTGMGTLLIYKDSANKDAGKVVFENATIIVESEGKQAPVYKFGATLFRLADNISVVFNRSFVAVDNGLETTSSMLWDNETTPDIEFIDSELYGIKDNRLHSDDKNSYFYESMDGIFSKINNLTKLSYVEDNCIFNL